MTEYTNIKNKDQCNLYFTDTIGDQDNLSSGHLKIKRIRIIYENKNENKNLYYLIGCFLDKQQKEVYIPGYKMNEFYSNTDSIILNNHVGKIYDVKLDLNSSHNIHKRYFISSIVKRINEEKYEDKTHTHYDSNNNQEKNTKLKKLENDIKKHADLLEELKQSTYSKSYIDKCFEDMANKHKNEIFNKNKDIQNLKQKLLNFETMMKKTEIKENNISLRRSKRRKH